jgi:arginase
MKTKTIITPYFLDVLLPGLESLKKWDWVIIKEKLPESTVMDRMSVLHASLADAVEEIAVEGDLPISIAGDCCSAIAVLTGIRRAGINPLLIWFDAHGDFNTQASSPSGFLGGMPLAMLVGKGDQSLLEAIDLEPIEEERVILTDGRDLDPEEQVLITRSSITHLRNTTELLDYSFSDHPLWIHFDTDILDPADVPAQNYPAPGGIHKQELKEVFQYLADTGLICGISLSSWAPDLPGADQSREVSLELLSVLARGSTH